MKWVQSHSKYFHHAKAKFATGADGWLVAYAQAHGATVVTNKQPAPVSKRDVKLPDVCDEFGVSRASMFDMLRALRAKFDWAGGLARAAFMVSHCGGSSREGSSAREGLGEG